MNYLHTLCHFPHNIKMVSVNIQIKVRKSGYVVFSNFKKLIFPLSLHCLILIHLIEIIATLSKLFCSLGCKQFIYFFTVSHVSFLMIYSSTVLRDWHCVFCFPFLFNISTLNSLHKKCECLDKINYSKLKQKYIFHFSYVDFCSTIKKIGIPLSLYIVTYLTKL